MFKRISFFILILSILFVLVGCSSDDEVTASWGQELNLAAGQTAVFDGGALKIKFESVTGDSRCQKGVYCIQAGEAKCQVLIGSDGSFSMIELNDRGGTDGYSETTYQNSGYRIKLSFRVEPYPEVGKQIEKSDYRLKLTVTKTS